ncbi:hypothetical protein [Actinoplanes sp. NPDC048796]|uniref:RICIN domain-containing protein n=1 Tax=unclassified Actinoplanes TaxID=2626549 RepID=UPI0033DC29E2
MTTRRALTGWLALFTALIATFAMGAAPAQAAPASFWLKSMKNGMCLDASSSQGVRLNSCNDGIYQRWHSDPTTDEIWNGTGKCLDGSTSQGVRLLDCNAGVYQKWVSHPADDSIRRATATTLCLDGSVSQGVRLLKCNSGDYQAWSLVSQ